MEKLRINNFAGLKSVELDISPVTGFIGPEASGKSIIAKLLYFFRQIASRLPHAIRFEQDGPQYKEECCKNFSRYFPIENGGLSDFQIEYLNNGQWVRVATAARNSAGEPSLVLEWSSFYDVAFEQFARKRKDLPTANDDPSEFATGILSLGDEIKDYITNALATWATFDQVFIPAGRSFFSQVQSTVFSQLAEGESPDPFMAEFGVLLQRSKSLLGSSGFFENAEFNGLRSTFEKILRAQMRRRGKQELLEFPDGRCVKLAQASSGQQEVLPLLLLLAQFVTFGNARGRAVYIEEPEAHLFPSTQKLIMEFMAQAFRARKSKICLVLTTHSPYILTSINNLLEAGKLYGGVSGKERQRLMKIIPRTHTFNPGEVGFYALEDGEAKSIVDGETGLIDADVIDQVSNDIAIQFDQLLAEGNEKS
jgi:ABC-type lipoprotein export system ATPase subunit